MDNKKEYRSLVTKLEIRSDEPQSRTIEGYAVVYDSRSENLGFYEYIDSGAINDDVLNRSDVMLLLDHDFHRGVLGRNRFGSVHGLELANDEHGLKIKCDVPNTSLGDEVLEYVRSGICDSMSFGFTCLDDEWSHEGEDYIRHIKAIDQLFDVSVVFNPAYSETEVACRSLDAFKAQEQRANEDDKKEDADEKPQGNENPDNKEEKSDDDKDTNEDNQGSNQEDTQESDEEPSQKDNGEGVTDDEKEKEQERKRELNDYFKELRSKVVLD